MTSPLPREEHLPYEPNAIPQTASVMRSGRLLDFADPRSDAFEIEDVVWGLSATLRFGGHSTPWMTVGEHSINVAERVWRDTGSTKAALCGLFHDAPEGLTGCDIPTPMKYALGAPQVRAFEARILAAVLKKLRLTPHWPVWAGRVARADRVELWNEAVLLGQDRPGGFYVPADFVPDRSLKAFVGDPEKVRARFRTVHEVLSAGHSPWR